MSSEQLLSWCNGHKLGEELGFGVDIGERVKDSGGIRKIAVASQWLCKYIAIKIVNCFLLHCRRFKLYKGAWSEQCSVLLFDSHVADVRRQLRCVAAPRDFPEVDTLWELGVEGTQGRSVFTGSALYTALLRGDGPNRSLLR